MLRFLKKSEIPSADPSAMPRVMRNFKSLIGATLLHMYVVTTADTDTEDECALADTRTGTALVFVFWNEEKNKKWAIHPMIDDEGNGYADMYQTAGLHQTAGLLDPEVYSQLHPCVPLTITEVGYVTQGHWDWQTVAPYIKLSDGQCLHPATAAKGGGTFHIYNEYEDSESELFDKACTFGYNPTFEES